MNEHLEPELTENRLDRTHRIANPKPGNKRHRRIIAKFLRYNTRRKVFVNKRRLRNTRISITKRLAKRKVGFVKKDTNMFGFNNVWTVDGRNRSFGEVAKKVKVSMHEKCPNTLFFWSVFSRTWTKYGKI